MGLSDLQKDTAGFRLLNQERLIENMSLTLAEMAGDSPLSEDEIALHAGITVEHLRMIFDGEVIPDLRMIADIATAAGFEASFGFIPQTEENYEGLV